MATRTKKKKKSTGTSTKKSRATRGGSPGLASAGSTTVSRSKVGVTVQAAVSGEGATVVTATAVDSSAETFQIDWS